MSKINEIKTAVALKYPEGAPAPFITAKGKGELARKIISVAEEKNIRIEENPDIINVLSAQEIGQAVPEETWEVLAVIFSAILERK